VSLHPTSILAAAALCLGLAFPLSSAQAAEVITTVAGNGTHGYSGDGGLALGAAIFYPSGVEADASGNFYLVGHYNNVIRRVDAASGIITTVAGSGTHGWGGDGGPATDAELAQPLGLALDPEGRLLYIADSYNSVVRRVDLEAGTISTFAGIGQSHTPTSPGEGDWGPATQAPLHAPSGVAVDADGHVYIADQPACRIRRVDVDTGIITTVAGTSWGGFSGDGGPAVAALLDNPFDVDVDAQGNLYISDLNNLRVRKVDAATGVITTIAGNGSAPNGSAGPATATDVAVGYPQQVSVDPAGEHVYFADQYNNRVWRIDADGSMVAVAGDGTFPAGTIGDGLPATSAQLYSPRGAWIHEDGCLYVADTYDSRIRHTCGLPYADGPDDPGDTGDTGGPGPDDTGTVDTGDTGGPGPDDTGTRDTDDTGTTAQDDTGADPDHSGEGLGSGGEYGGGWDCGAVPGCSSVPGSRRGAWVTLALMLAFVGRRRRSGGC